MVIDKKSYCNFNKRLPRDILNRFIDQKANTSIPFRLGINTHFRTVGSSSVGAHPHPGNRTQVYLINYQETDVFMQAKPKAQHREHRRQNRLIDDYAKDCRPGVV